MVCGSSLKAALDRDWDQPGQCEEALGVVLRVLQAVETWVQTLPQDEMELARPSLEVACQVKEQDVQIDEHEQAHLIKGVARDRRISIEDALKLARFCGLTEFIAESGSFMQKSPQFGRYIVRKQV
jgi:hypothetical protein